jgi:hypothetical protein
MMATFPIWCSKSKLKHSSNRGSSLNHGFDRKANREFAAVASKFMEEVQQQMGVKLFILGGYKDIDGKIARVK